MDFLFKKILVSLPRPMVIAKAMIVLVACET
jgi:hypothetical protein